MSGTGIDVVPKLPKCLVLVIPAVCLGTHGTEHTLLCTLLKRYPLDYQLKRKVNNKNVVSLNLKEDKLFAFLRLTIMRIRFRASDFGLVAKIKLSRAKSKQASCAEIMPGSFFFARVIQQLGVWTQGNSSQRRLLLHPAPCRAHFARPWTQASKPTLRL